MSTLSLLASWLFSLLHACSICNWGALKAYNLLLGWCRCQCNNVLWTILGVATSVMGL